MQTPRHAFPAAAEYVEHVGGSSEPEATLLPMPMPPPSPLPDFGFQWGMGVGKGKGLWRHQ
ncbi:MAG TPA: hypothetical protein VKE94_21090, partial [Gemmataceae bacterium]|nr:hypothetical protein [Gemmataceae bacterium]